MEFRLAKGTDKNNLYSLWENTFGDDKDTIDLYFDSIIKLENTVVCVENDTLVSMLYLLPASIKYENEELKLYCIYAAATNESFRKQGIMSKLIDYACEIAKQRNIDYVFLRPANEKLFSYYEKCNFKKAFYLKKVEEKNIPNDYSYSFIAWNEAVIGLNKKFSENKAFICEYGYADYYENNNELFVQCFVSGNIKELLKVLKKENSNKNIYVDLPVEAEADAVAQGMIRKVSGKAFPNCAYMGITLE